jgi:hypothetical protein
MWQPRRTAPGETASSGGSPIWQAGLMRLTDKLSQAQRVVVVVALGLALGVLAGYLTSLGGGSDFGWYAYAPLSGQAFAPNTGLSGWLRLVIWLAVIGLWALGSLRVLRPRPEPEEKA